MPTLHLTTPGTRVQLESERLLITPPDTPKDNPTTHTVHIRDIERLFLHERTAITLPSLAELARRQLPVIILDNHGQLLAFLQHPTPLRTTLHTQYQRAQDPQFALAIAIALIEAKILNQRRVLQRLAANRPQTQIDPILNTLKQHAQHALTAQSLETLRGHEGAAAGLYFETYATFFPSHIPFVRRSRRPPLNPPNAILSYTYTLLTAECYALLHTNGLDPTLGFYHQPQDNRPALALDLIEPFRAPVADALALDLLTHGTLHPTQHFQTRDDGGCYLNLEGKRRFFVAYERRMEREYTHAHTHTRTTIRRELQNQILALRNTIHHQEPLTPYRMN